MTVGDLVVVSIKEMSGTAVEVQLEQDPAAQAALLSIDNPTGEIKAMVGGYDFDESKFDRATQAMRQTGSSFKVYVYATATRARRHAVRYRGGRTRHVSAAAARIILRTITTKNSRGESRIAARSPIPEIFRRCDC